MEKTKIQKLYENEKSRSFVNHLINSYLPVHKIHKVFVFEDDKPTHKCCICNKKLISINEIFSSVKDNKDEFMKTFISSMKKHVKGEAITIDDNPYVKIIGKDKILAYTGEKTNTYMCHACSQDLLNMVQYAMLCGDTNINYQVNKMRRTELFDTFKNNPSLDESDVNTVERIQKKVEKTSNHKATFGDLEVLQQLKKKMETKN